MTFAVLSVHVKFFFLSFKVIKLHKVKFDNLTSLTTIIFDGLTVQEVVIKLLFIGNLLVETNNIQCFLNNNDKYITVVGTKNVIRVDAKTGYNF